MDTTKSYYKQNHINQKSSSILYLATHIHFNKIVAGGIVTHTKGVISGFINTNISVICAASHMQEHIESIPGISAIFTLKNPSCLRWLRWRVNCLLSNIFFTIQILSIFRKHSIDYIYQRYTPYNVTSIVVSNIKNIPSIIEYNGSELWVAQNWHETKKKFFCKFFLMHSIELLVLRRATLIITISQALKDELIKKGIEASKILVNPNGVDPHYFDPQKLHTVSRNLIDRLHLTGKIIIGFIGTFSSWHGIHIIEQIIKAYRHAKHAIHFIIIGEGKLYKNFQKIIQYEQLTSMVTLTGLLPHHQACEYLAICDIFLCPTQKNTDGSRFFGSPTKLFEYMSLGKPVIASDIEQLSKILSPAITIQNRLHPPQGAIGFVAYPDHAQEFIDLLHYVLDMPKTERDMMGQRARKKILTYYTWNKHIERTVAFINKYTSCS